MPKRIEISNEEEKTFAPDFWDNAKEAEKVMRELRTQKKWVEDYEEAESLTSDVEVLLDFFKEGESTADEVDQQYAQALHAIEALEFRNMLSDEGDAMSAVLQITAPTS